MKAARAHGGLPKAVRSNRTNANALILATGGDEMEEQSGGGWIQSIASGRPDWKQLIFSLHEICEERDALLREIKALRRVMVATGSDTSKGKSDG
jgi:hypothetical protein